MDAGTEGEPITLQMGGVREKWETEILVMPHFPDEETVQRDNYLTKHTQQSWG